MVGLLRHFRHKKAISCLDIIISYCRDYGRRRAVSRARTACDATDLVAFPVVEADPRRRLDPLVLELVRVGVLLTLSAIHHRHTDTRTACTLYRGADKGGLRGLSPLKWQV